MLKPEQIIALFELYHHGKSELPFWKAREPGVPLALNDTVKASELPKKLSKRARIALQAREKLILHNMGLVTRCVDKYKNKEKYHEELAQAGVCGLVKAVDTYDLSRNVLFSTHATWKIMQQIYVCAARVLRLIRFDSATIEEVRLITKKREECMRETGTATLRQVAKKVNTLGYIPIEQTMERIQNLMLFTRDPQSMHMLTDHNEEYELPVVMEQPKNFSFEQVTAMRYFLEQVNIPEEDIYLVELLMGINGDCMSVGELSEMMNMETEVIERRLLDMTATIETYRNIGYDLPPIHF